MNLIIRSVSITLTIISLAACATTPKIPMRPEVRQSIKKIALVETPEPSQYFVNPAPSPACAALFVFGAFGGAIAGGIEAKRAKQATTKFTETVTPLHPKLATTMLAELEKGLIEIGYGTQYVPPLSMTADGKDYNFSDIKGDFDAILIPTLSGGYSGISPGKITPEVRVSISIYSKSGKDILFADSYIYRSGNRRTDNRIDPDPKYVLKSVDAIYEDIGVAVEGLKIGAGKVAELAVSDLQ